MDKGAFLCVVFLFLSYLSSSLFCHLHFPCWLSCLPLVLLSFHLAAPCLFTRCYCVREIRNKNKYFFETLKGQCVEGGQGMGLGMGGILSEGGMKRFMWNIRDFKHSFRVRAKTLSLDSIFYLSLPISFNLVLSFYFSDALPFLILLFSICFSLLFSSVSYSFRFFSHSSLFLLFSFLCILFPFSLSLSGSASSLSSLMFSFLSLNSSVSLLSISYFFPHFFYPFLSFYLLSLFFHLSFVLLSAFVRLDIASSVCECL